MRSLAVTGRQYLQRTTDVESWGPFRYRFLAEGDSWMDRSSPLIAALPDFLAQEMNRRGEAVLIINIAAAGDTLRRIASVLQGEFGFWLGQFRYDAILLSVGGNDFIDAALDPDPGQGILRDMPGLPPPADGSACVAPQALATLVDGYLNPNFTVLYDAVRSGALNAATPLFLNCYDTPTARDAPAAPNVGPWLFTAYNKNGIAPELWPQLTAALFDDIEQTIAGWTTGRDAIFAVPTRGVLTPAAPGTTDGSGDWANEIHPNRSGWRKLAAAWAADLLSRLG
ncbi:MAG: hypothetical protein OJF60_002819 [Burkholderiaceae bacterium]|nr:MAG: hypothetical protein OJF60_002819 [Burkholderiaceae bacterium]